MTRKQHAFLKRKGSWKRTLAGLMAIIFFLVVIAPVQVSAAPPWWNRFKEIVKADAVGAIGGGLGSDFSWSWPGAIGGAITGSINAGMDDGASGSGWTSEADAALTIGQLHNTGMNHVYAWGEANLMDEDGKVYAWGRNEASMDLLVDATLEHLRNNGLEVDGTVERTLRGLDPAYEEIMKRIKDALGQGSNGSTSPVSDNFYSNLEQALAILDQEADDPRVLIEESAQFMVEASVKESDPEAVRMAGQLFADDGTLLDTMDIVVVVPGRAGSWLTDEGNNDILLAAVYADVLRASYDYRTYDCDDTDSCVLPGFTDFNDPDADADGLPDFLDPDDDDDGIPTVDVEVVLTLDQTRAMVNGETKVMDTPAFVTEGRTLVPFRFIGEELGATIGWDGEERKVSYVLGDNEVELWIGQSRAMVNGTATTVDENPTVTPVIVNGRTVVPVRFISEALGAKVEWNPDTREVTIIKHLDKASPLLFDTL